MVFRTLAVLFLLITVLSAVATPAEPNRLERRLGGKFFVSVRGAKDFCMLMPSSPHTKITDAGQWGTWSRCYPGSQKTQAQMDLSPDFWSKVSFKSGNKTGKRFAQLTGCIRPHSVDRLVPNDVGGQYQNDKNGETICFGYKHYVEIIEPVKHRACIKCCDDPADCQPSSKVHPHCPKVIPGKYFNCA